MYDLTYHHANEILRSSQGHGLFIGDAASAQDVQWLRGQGIRTVMTVASGFQMSYESSIRHIRYQLQDKKSENISRHFDAAAQMIDKQLRNGGVLVHCGAGISRSPTLVIAFLIRHRGMGFLEALRFVKSKRPQVCPNLGFELQLKSYEKAQHQGNLFLMAGKRREKKQLPEIVKYQPSSTYNKPFHRGQALLSKSLKPVQRRERSELQCLRRMAEFRFGITNMSRWKMLAPGQFRH